MITPIEIAGYPYKRYEWKYGDNVIVSLWANGMEGHDDAVLIVEGTGAMWDYEEATERLGDFKPWGNPDECIYFNNSIKEAYVGEGITTIEDLGMVSMNKITLPSTLKKVGVDCFYQTAITEIVLPEGVETVETGAFAVCPEAERIILPSTLKYIGDWAFDLRATPEERSKNKVEEVVIPKGVEYIGFSAFGWRWGIDIVVPKGLNTDNFDKEWDLISY